MRPHFSPLGESQTRPSRQEAHSSPSRHTNKFRLIQRARGMNPPPPGPFTHTPSLSLSPSHAHTHAHDRDPGAAGA